MREYTKKKGFVSIFSGYLLMQKLKILRRNKKHYNASWHASGLNAVDKVNLNQGIS